jgi:hypothetical protein
MPTPIDDAEYKALRESTQTWFQSLTPIQSPALEQLVHFTSEGFEHLMYKGSRSMRDRSSQVMRFKLLRRAMELISLSSTIQEYEETTKSFLVKRHKRKGWEVKTVYYWGFIAILRNRKIKVIVRKIGGGQIHFWSVIPSWTTNRYRDIKLISTMKGNPEED